jgi:hypothetical protein
MPVGRMRSKSALRTGEIVESANTAQHLERWLQVSVQIWGKQGDEALGSGTVEVN